MTLPVEMHLALQALKVRHGVGISEAVVEAVGAYLAEQAAARLSEARAAPVQDAS